MWFVGDVANMITKRRRLAGFQLKGAAGVDHGANNAQMSGAEGWMVMKADGTAVTPVTKTKENDVPEPTVESLQEALAKAEADLKAATERADALEKAAKAKPKPGGAAEDAADGGKDDAEEDDAKKIAKALEAAPELRAIIEKAQSDAAAAQAQADEATKIAKAEYDARVDGEWIAKAAEFKGLPTTPEAFGPVLRSVYETAVAAKAPALYNELDRVLRGATEVVKASGLFNESGSNSAAGASAWDAITKAAEDLRIDSAKAGVAMTTEQSISKVTELRPDLAAAYKKESR